MNTFTFVKQVYIFRSSFYNFQPILENTLPIYNLKSDVQTLYHRSYDYVICVKFKIIFLPDFFHIFFL